MSRCTHGLPSSGIRINSLMDDVEIVEKNLKQPVPSKKVEKKARARIEKAHRPHIRENGKSDVLAIIYSSAVQAILESNIVAARGFCQWAILFQSIVWNENNHTEKELLLSSKKINTNRGVILHLASRIPCGCLNQLKREMKAKPRDALCGGCEEKKPFDDFSLQCSACKIEMYCSEDCQRKHWKEHKATCRTRARMDYIKELKEKEMG